MQIYHVIIYNTLGISIVVTFASFNREHFQIIFISSLSVTGSCFFAHQIALSFILTGCSDRKHFTLVVRLALGATILLGVVAVEVFDLRLIVMDQRASTFSSTANIILAYKEKIKHVVRQKYLIMHGPQTRALLPYSD